MHCQKGTNTLTELYCTVLKYYLKLENTGTFQLISFVCCFAWTFTSSCANCQIFWSDLIEEHIPKRQSRNSGSI